MDESAQTPSRPPTDTLQSRLATVYSDLGSGRLQEAGHTIDELLAAYPGLPEIHRARAAWLQVSGRGGEAIGAMHDALVLAPADAGLWGALGQVQASMGRFDDAIASFRTACRHRPDAAEAWYFLGATLGGVGRLAEALSALARAHALAPAEPMVTEILADVLYRLGRCDEALVHLEWLSRDASARSLPPDALRTLRIVQCHRSLGDPVQALRAANAGAEDCFAPLWLEIGGIHEDLGDAEAAHAAYLRACALQPGWPEPLAALIGLRREDTPDAIVETAHAFLAQPTLPPRSRALLCHALGRRADRLGENDVAAECWHEANRLRRAEDGALDRTAHSARIDALIARTRGGVHSVQRERRATAPRPLFVVGMPRSGTTLVERILAAHPEAHGCGELTVFTGFGTSLPDAPFTPDASILDELAGRWHAAVERMAPAGVALAIDKHPFNLEQLALVAAALPDARVVWCRRDPRDTALSIYAESFMPEATYATDLDDIRFLMAKQCRLMRHWREVLALPVLELRYEALVDAPEAQARRLLDFAGLTWDDQCLRFHAQAVPVQTHSRWQVRQPIHRDAVGRWRRYRDWFEGWDADAADEAGGEV